MLATVARRAALGVSRKPANLLCPVGQQVRDLNVHEYVAVVAPTPVAKTTAAARTAGGPSYFSTANRQAKERAEQQRGVLAQV